MRRALLFCAAIAFAIACGDDITEPIPDRTPVVKPPVSFATTTTEDGLSISTDKDDYAPGDTVHFTGSGWEPGHVLEIVLTDDPLTHEAHTWTVNVEADGIFRDATYVVDEGDLNVTFTLVATDPITGQSLTVIFTDGNLQFQPNPTPDPFSPNADAVKDATIISWRITGNGNENGVALRIREGTLVTGTTVRNFSIGNKSPGDDGTVTWDGKNEAATPVVVSDGEYTVRIFSSTQNEASATSNQRMYTMLVDNAVPVISSPQASPGSVTQGLGTAVTVTAIATDNPVAGVSANRYTILSAEYNIDGGSTFTPITIPNQGTNVKNLSAIIPGTTIQGLSSGSHSICIRATDNAGNRSPNNAANNSNCAALQVNANVVATTTTVTSSLNPSGFEEAVTFTATVTSGTPAVAVTAGNVTFKDGSCASGTVLGTGPVALSGTGQAAVTVSTLALGSHTISGCYGGSTGFQTSEGSVSQQVNSTATNLTLVSSANPSKTGQTVTFTATVSNNGNAISTGTLVFKTGGDNCSDQQATQVQGPHTPSSGVVTYSASFNAVQSAITVRACYGGSTSPLLAASEASIVQTVEKAPTTTTLTSVSPNPVIFGNSVTVHFTVSPTNTGSGYQYNVSPTGTVSIKDGSSTVLCSGSVSAGACTFSPPGAGTLSLTANYESDANFLASISEAASLKVEKATPAFSNLSSPTITFGDSPTSLSGKIAAGSLIPSGDVSITLNGVTHTAAIASDGTFSASFATGLLGVAGSPYNISYTYGGDPNFNAAPDGAGTLTVEKATPVFSNLSSPTITYGATPTALSGKVSKGSLVPTGNVSIVLNGVTKQAPIATNGNFSSSFTTNALGVANSPYAITYSYGGDANFNPVSPDGTGSLTVNPAPLTVKADDKQKNYDGHAFTAFTASITGFVNSEGPSVLGGALSFTGSAVGAVDAGSYTITPDGLTSTNYLITFTSAELKIDKVLLTVTAVNRQKVWDGQPYPFNTNPVTTTDVTYSGFVNNEGPSVLTGPLVFSAASQVAKGTYTNTPSGLSATNYNFSYVAGALVIQAWTITGFFQPVDMSAGGNVWNTTKGGYTIPLKFRVFAGTVEKTDVAAIKSFVQTKLTCPDTPTTDEIEIVSTGGTTLRYDVSGSQFVQNWQTPKPASTCYKVTMTTLDDSFITALFKTR